MASDSIPVLDFQPAEKRGLVDEVADRLFQAIVGGQIAQGQRINEAQVAQLLQTSRAPVREAFARLSEQGIIERVANRGAFVVKLTLQDIEELWSLRNVLEQFAVSLLARHREENSCAELEAVLEEMRQAASHADNDQLYAELGMRFHEALITATGHRRLLSAWSTLRNQTQLLLCSSMGVDQSYRGTMVVGHREILELIRQGNEVQARELVEKHLQASYAGLAAICHTAA